MTEEILYESDRITQKAKEIKEEFTTEVPQHEDMTPAEWLSWKLDKIYALEKDARRLKEHLHEKRNNQGISLAPVYDTAPIEKAYFCMLKEIHVLREGEE